MKVIRKSLIWHELVSCDKCGSDYWRKIGPDLKPQSFCEPCNQQFFDELVSCLEKAGLTPQVEILKELVHARS